MPVFCTFFDAERLACQRTDAATHTNPMLKRVPLEHMTNGDLSGFPKIFPSIAHRKSSGASAASTPRIFPIALASSSDALPSRLPLPANLVSQMWLFAAGSATQACSTCSALNLLHKLALKAAQRTRAKAPDSAHDQPIHPLDMAAISV
eukprot:CAMPEP_0169301914 /NCGR_PEP_ID=MMETSP1016-20121227/68513_1 /TAXON_ID=342587 /ORGANISM="Karlodinium micrum, Strain CCMP2283" /LENGTH=148 /DNA_ID=CAMNT_0009394575 /DNA_START=103 /DNA_END=550 /DNA_ORIENTATION=-